MHKVFLSRSQRFSVGMNPCLKRSLMLFQSLFHSLSLMNPASMQHQGRNKSTDRKKKKTLVIQYIHVVGEPHFLGTC